MNHRATHFIRRGWKERIYTACGQRASELRNSILIQDGYGIAMRAKKTNFTRSADQVTCKLCQKALAREVAIALEAA